MTTITKLKKIMGRVLVACEESQAVTIAFRKLGHEAYSCDIQECSGGHPEWHIQGDAITALYARKWDLVIAHPPCTFLANSGVRWLYKNKQLTPNVERWLELEKALEFIRDIQAFFQQTDTPGGFENPIPHKYAREGFWLNDYVRGIPPKRIFGIGEPTQIIHPWQFGHSEKKATCLWLYNLPKLEPTDIVTGDLKQSVWLCPPGPDRQKIRSKSFTGIAQAMAEQWGRLI